MDYLRFLKQNWRFLGFGLFLTFFSSFGQTYFVGVFSEAIQATFQISHGEYGRLYMIATFASAVLLTRVGPLIDAVDLRVFAALVCGGVVAACFLMSTASTLLWLTVALFALRFSGQGLMGHTAFTSMARYFDEGRGKAISIAGLGFSAGNAVFPPLGAALLAAMVWPDAWFALGLGAAALLVPTVLWLLRGHPERHRAWRERTAEVRPGRAHGDGPKDDGPRQWTRAQVLRDPRFYLLVPAVVSPTFILTGLFFHQGFVAVSKGWTPEWLAVWFIGFGVAGSITSLTVGTLIDRWSARRMVQLYLVPLALSLAALAIWRHPITAAVFLALAGVNAGAAAPTMGSLWAELYGVLHLGSIRALTTALMVISTGLAPPVFGWLIDAGWSASHLASASVVYVVIGVGLIAVAMRRPG